MVERQSESSYGAREEQAVEPDKSAPLPHPSYAPIHQHTIQSHTPAASSTYLAPLSAPRPLSAFNLPNLPSARNSASSLMDAVLGNQPILTVPPSRHTAPYPQPTPPTAAMVSPPHPQPIIKRKAKGSVSRTPSTQSRSQSTTETESWDVLSDADSRLNEGEGEREEVVAELQKKVDRRKSQLPQLESQLADLEAQIKAAEERLAKAQVAQGQEITPLAQG